MPLIQLENIHKTFDVPQQSFFEKKKVVHAVNGIHLTLVEGESFGVVGESGCGKSTTGQLIVRLLKPTEGSITYKGRDIATMNRQEMKQWRKEVQIVFQDPYSSLNPRKTVFSIVEEPLRIHRLGNAEQRREKVSRVLQDVGIDESFFKRYPHQLSGGQRQRVAIASALVLDPSFIVIDEGVSALDVSVQAQILNVLKKIQKQYQLTYLFISHDLNVIQYFCDRIAVMYLGEIVEIIERDNVGKTPVHPYAKALFSAIPQVDQKGALTLLEGEIPSPIDLPLGCKFSTRCPYMQETCLQKSPTLDPLANGNAVRCHFASSIQKGDIQ